MQITSLKSENLNHFPVPAPVMRRMFARGESRPEWCFLAWQGGQPVGALGFCGQPAAPQILETFGLQADGRSLPALVGHAGPVLQAQGARALAAQVDFESQAAGLVAAGFTRVQERSRWRWDSPWPPVPESAEWTFRDMDRSGEAEFIETLTQLYANSREPLLRCKRRIWGAAQAAQITLDDLKTRNAHSHWWQIGYGPGGMRAGLVCPYLEAPRSGTFGLLECVSDSAIAGLQEALLARGTAVLQSRGVDEIGFCASPVWDAAFASVGEYQLVGRRQVLILALE